MTPARALEKSPWYTQRRTELDGMRVIAFGILILYHVGMLYVADWGWHFKSDYRSERLQLLMLWCNQWRMPLIFLISGVAVSYLIHTLRYWQFFTTRCTRLLLPLLFGMGVVVVPQVYVELRCEGVIERMGYGQFWLAYLTPQSPMFAEATTVANYHYRWNHLWFLLYVLAYSLAVGVLYPLLNAQRSQRFWRWLGVHCPSWCLVCLPILLLFCIGQILWARFPVTHGFFNDWYNHANSMSFFMLGFALARAPKLWLSVLAMRWWLLSLAIATYSYCAFVTAGGRLGAGWWVELVNGFLWSANSWLWVLSVLAWAQRYLRTTNGSLLQYLNGGIYCFYMLHQTFIIVVAYWLAPIRLGPVLEPFWLLRSRWAAVG